MAGDPRTRPPEASAGSPNTVPPRRTVLPIEAHHHFEPQPASVRAARHAVAAALVASRYAGDHDTVLLLASELITNAVRHAATPFDLSILVEGIGVTVAVVDHDQRHPPRLRNPSPEATSGRGLRIVDQLSSRWGTEPLDGDAKRVWFSCAAPGSGHGGPSGPGPASAGASARGGDAARLRPR
jgi:hypothetical protein